MITTTNLASICDLAKKKKIQLILNLASTPVAPTRTQNNVTVQVHRSAVLENGTTKFCKQEGTPKLHI